MDLAPAMHVFVQTVIYTVFGLVVFGIAYWMMIKMAPFSIRR